MKQSIVYLLLFSFLVVQGCRTAKDVYPPTVHDLGPPVSRQNDMRLKNGIVTTVDAPVWLWDDRIRYRLLYVNPTKIGFYAHDRWIGPPPELLKHKLVSANNKKTPFLLEIRLLDLEQLFKQPNQSYVVMNVHASVRTPESRKVIAKRDFWLQQQTAPADVTGAIAGFATLSDRFIEELNQWLETLKNPKQSSATAP